MYYEDTSNACFKAAQKFLTSITTSNVSNLEQADLTKDCRTGAQCGNLAAPLGNYHYGSINCHHDAVNYHHGTVNYQIWLRTPYPVVYWSVSQSLNSSQFTTQKKNTQLVRMFCSCLCMSPVEQKSSWPSCNKILCFICTVNQHAGHPLSNNTANMPDNGRVKDEQ